MAPSPKSNTGSLAILALAALSALGGVAVMSSPSVSRATGSTILYAGAALQTFSGLAHQTTTKTETLNCDCASKCAARRLLKDVFEPVDTGFEAAGRELATTLAPTVAIDSWTVYFTATMSSVGSLIPTSYGSGQQKSAKFPTSKAPISVVFHLFRLIFGRVIISRNGLAWTLVFERARAEQPS